MSIDFEELETLVDRLCANIRRIRPQDTIIDIYQSLLLDCAHRLEEELENNPKRYDPNYYWVYKFRITLTDGEIIENHHWWIHSKWLENGETYLIIDRLPGDGTAISLINTRYIKRIDLIVENEGPKKEQSD